MWISRKKFRVLEKRIADLEGQVQSQQTICDYLQNIQSNTESILDYVDVRKAEYVGNLNRGYKLSGQPYQEHHSFQEVLKVSRQYLQE